MTTRRNSIVGHRRRADLDLDTAPSARTEALKVEVRTIYALSTPRHIQIQFYGCDGGNPPHPLRIKADSIEQTKRKTILKAGTETVGEFSSGAIAGWWIEEETPSHEIS